MDLEPGFDDCSEIPLNFISKFLSNITNKTNLKKYQAKKFLAYHQGKQSILCVTFGDSFISNRKPVLSETDMNQCSCEDANPGIVHHVINLKKKGYTIVRVKAADSNVSYVCWRYVKWNWKFSCSLWSKDKKLIQLIILTSSA